MSNVKILSLSVLDNRPLARRYTVTFLDRMPVTPKGYRIVEFGRWAGTNWRTVTFELIEESCHDRRD